MLLKLASNILREPENEKYHRFKPTNTQIHKNIVNVKGGLEYAVEVRGRVVYHVSESSTSGNLTDGVPGGSRKLPTLLCVPAIAQEARRSANRRLSTRGDAGEDRKSARTSEAEPSRP